MTASYALTDAELLAGCEQRAYSGSGPGGQHRNRHAAGVALHHRASGCQAECNEQRDRSRNLALALRRLRLRLALHERGTAERAWLEARRDGRRLPVGSGAAGFHLVVGVVMDALAEGGGSPAQAGEALALSTSQVVKFLCADKEVRQAADALRATHGLPPLKS